MSWDIWGPLNWGTLQAPMLRKVLELVPRVSLQKRLTWWNKHHNDLGRRMGDRSPQKFNDL